MSDISAAEDPFANFPEAVDGGVEKEDPFAAFPPAETTGAEKAIAVAQGATGGFLELAPIGAGMVMGAELGALGGPFAPFTIPAGAAIGGVAGFMAGKGLREAASEIPLPSGTRTLTTPSVEAMRPELRPFGFAGEVLGTGAPIVAAPLIAARAGARLPPSMVGSFINRIIGSAATAPGTFVAAEAAGLSGSAGAAAVAESFAPGETGKRIAAEIAGGLFSPIRLITSATKGSLDIAKAAFETMTTAGKETRAAKFLINAVTESGEDPAALAKILSEPGLELTAGQKSGSPALIAVESMLRQKSAKFGSDAAKLAEEGLASIRAMMVALRQTGDPQALVAAAKMRGQYFRTLLAGRLGAAEAEATEAAAKITKDTPRARAELSKVAQNSVDEALKDARKAESELWQAIPRETPADAKNVIDAHDAIRAELLPEETIPDVVEGFVARMKGEELPSDLSEETRNLIQEVFGEAPARVADELPTNSGELLRLRTRMLARARDAAATPGGGNDARIFGQIAEAALDDLSDIGARAGGALDEARAFSRELHDTFTRTFAGTATGTTRTGAARIPPELILRRALGTGREAGELRLREIEDATRFLSNRGLDSPEAAQNIDVMLDAQERLLRLAADESVSETGRVSTAKLSKFLKDNESLLDRFPEVRADIKRALSMEGRLADVQSLTTGATRVINQKAAFAKIAKVENPVDAVAAAVRGNNPVADLIGMVKVAKRGGAEAVEGLKGAVFDHVLRQAGDDFGKLRGALLDPIRPGQPSIAELMRRAGVMTKQDIDRATKLIEEADNITDALARGAALDDVLEAPDALFDLVLRVVGARAGAQGAVGAASGSSLVAAQRGSQFFRNVFGKLPVQRVTDVLIEAAKDPRFTALLLRSAPTQADKITLSRQIHAYMLQAGLFNSRGEDVLSPGEEVSTEQ